MRRRLVLGGVLGGVVLFVWGMISYMLLPWHAATLEQFKDEQAVAQVLAANAAGSGVYLLPNPHRHDPALTAEQRKAAAEDGVARMMQGPFMFAAVSLHGARDMGAALLMNLLVNMVSAGLVLWLLMQTGGLSYRRRVGFVVMVALAAAMIVHGPYWIWWGFSTPFTLVEFADPLIGWFLVGLVLARLAPAPTSVRS